MVMEEPPIEASWEFTEVRVEEVDDAPLYPSSADSDTSTSIAASSSPPAVTTSSQLEVLEFYYIVSLGIAIKPFKKFLK